MVQAGSSGATQAAAAAAARRAADGSQPAAVQGDLRCGSRTDGCPAAGKNRTQLTSRSAPLFGCQLVSGASSRLHCACLLASGGLSMCGSCSMHGPPALPPRAAAAEPLSPAPACSLEQSHLPNPPLPLLRRHRRRRPKQQLRSLAWRRASGKFGQPRAATGRARGSRCGAGARPRLPALQTVPAHLGGRRGATQVATTPPCSLLHRPPTALGFAAPAASPAAPQLVPSCHCCSLSMNRLPRQARCWRNLSPRLLSTAAGQQCARHTGPLPGPRRPTLTIPVAAAPPFPPLCGRRPSSCWRGTAPPTCSPPSPLPPSPLRPATLRWTRGWTSRGCSPGSASRWGADDDAPRSMVVVVVPRQPRRTSFHLAHLETARNMNLAAAAACAGAARAAACLCVL